MASLTTTTSFFNKQCRTSLEKNVVNRENFTVKCQQYWLENGPLLFLLEKNVVKVVKKCALLFPLHASCPLENRDFLPQIWCSPFNKDQTPFSFKENTQSVSFQRLQYLKIARGTTDPGVTPLLGATF